MTTRDDIATAASVADLTNVTPYYRQSIKAGDGFVRLAQRERDSSGFGWIDTYEVWLALPSDTAAAEKWLETNIDTLIGAINPVLLVTRVTPAELGLGGTTVPGVIIAGSIAA